MLLNLPAMIESGRSIPFGAHLAAGGINFAVFSEHATRMELCIFDAEGEIELKRYDLFGPDDAVFHGFLSGLSAGLVYGYRAHGPYAPERGHRFNPNKVLLDPYAREIVGRFSWADVHFGYALGHPQGARSFDARDNAALALKARVAPPSGVRTERPRARAPAPEFAAHEVVLYEVHVKGFSKSFAAIPDHLRGTYAGLAHPAAIAHFKALGVTTLAMLPVHYSISEAHLARLGLSNYWGYNSIGFFALEPRLGRADSANEPGALNLEFRQMTDALHAAGLEVVLDVVFNHSAEGDELGPSISFRGLDNASYYCAQSDDLSRCVNFSGCGNTLNIAQPRVTQLVLDSLRYWAVEMGIDGFRFDLAAILGRDHTGISGHTGFNTHAAFFTALRQDPVLSTLRLIAEPWDCGPQGYQLGRFPGRFIEWNDRFRDAMRRYWLGDAVPVQGLSRGEFARRFFGSSDFFQHAGKRPSASVNFITAHDGFTLGDVLSYTHKHNDANGEQNRDGRHDELCANFGVEGQSSEPHIENTRTQVRHALLASLILAQGTPMLLAGDEIGNSQGGNNNAYCQDNATAWLDWQNADVQTLRVVQALIALRAATPLLHYPDWFASNATELERARVIWHAPDGRTMALHDWHDTTESALAAEMFAVHAVQPSIRILFNPEPHTTRFALGSNTWRLLFDSSAAFVTDPNAHVYTQACTQAFVAPAHALLVLARTDAPQFALPKDAHD